MSLCVSEFINEDMISRRSPVVTNREAQRIFGGPTKNIVETIVLKLIKRCDFNCVSQILTSN